MGISWHWCRIIIGNEKFKLVGIDAPMPEEICNYTINCVYKNKDELDVMRQHNYYVITFYEGVSTDQNEIYNPYAKLAYGFIEHNLLGMSNGYSWNALSPYLISLSYK